MKKYMNRNLCKGLSFLMTGVLIFTILQQIIVPKQYPYEKFQDAGKLRYFAGEKKNSIDVLLLGTSHIARGILPMEMYERYGIKSYNLATSGQPIEMTYYTLEEAIKTQKPKAVVWDVSSLYSHDADSWYWKIVLNEMNVSKNKKLAVKEYLKQYEDYGETMASLMIPLLEYHTRWKEIEKQDFEFLSSNKRYFSKGGQINSYILRGVSVNDMNLAVEDMMGNTVKEVREYNNHVFHGWQEQNELYSVSIIDSNKEWAVRIKELCDANHIQLLAVKVPNAYMPQQYSSAWTIERYKKTQAFCEEVGITYFDMLYDVDFGIDFERDSYDGGMHLNLYGARKASEGLGNYLKEHYQLSEKRDEQWDKDLLSYQKARKVALLELEQDFSTYIHMLADEYKDHMIFITASDDMAQGLHETDINALRELGLRTDFSGAFRNSYLAVLENGEVKYEALSNRSLEYSGVCEESGTKYKLYSSGWWTVAGASIRLDGDGYAVGSRGLNIVVYDDERRLVLDSVCFDTCMEDHTAARNNNMINQMEEEFERYIMEVEDK